MLTSRSNKPVPVPHIPSRSERRRLAKKAGVFGHKGGWKQVNEAANMQREIAIEHNANIAMQRQNMDGKELKVLSPVEKTDEGA